MATSGSKEARQLEQVRYNLEKGLAKINEKKGTDNNVATNKIEYSIDTLEDGTPYTILNVDIDENNIKEIANEYIKSLDGKIIQDIEGKDITFYNRLINIEGGKSKNVVNELQNNQKTFYSNVDYQGDLKNAILNQLEEVMEISKAKKTIPDKGEKHKEYNINSFDISETLVYAKDNFYKLQFDVANLNTGERVLYSL